ncbi:MAG: hypothetical protein FJ029_04195 [Actinobacteria bacterium]|nr:hypothetical protein [Actinomycetota bacterium]
MTEHEGAVQPAAHARRPLRARAPEPARAPTSSRTSSLGTFLAVVGVALALLLVVTAGSALLAVNATSSPTITSSSAATDDKLDDVTAVSSTYTRTNGQAQLVSGVQLYQIKLGDANLGDRLVVNFL